MKWPVRLASEMVKMYFMRIDCSLDIIQLTAVVERCCSSVIIIVAVSDVAVELRRE